MRPLLGPQGEAALAALLARGPLLAFDFDGTLAPIVLRPGQARPPPAVSAALAQLATQLPVAVVSGRAVQDLRTRLGFEPAYLVGNHGAEGLPGVELPADGLAALEALRSRAAARQAVLAAAGVFVEDKRLSLSLHYRLARDPACALQCIGELLGTAPATLQVFGGKQVVNVVVAGAPDKAEAMLYLLQACGAPCAFFAGDDLNDEPVFAAAPADWITVRVGRTGVRSRARYALDSAAEMALLLERMLALLALLARLRAR